MSEQTTKIKVEDDVAQDLVAQEDVVEQVDMEVVAEEDVSTANTNNSKSKSAKANGKSIGKRSVSYLAKISILSAMAVVLLYIEFPLLPATPWLKLNVSDVPALLATFIFGPVSGTVVNAIKIGVCLLIRGTSSAFVGDLSNLISGTLYVVVAGIIYKLNKDKVGAIISLVVSSLVFCGIMWLTNQYMLLPFYGMTDSTIVIPALWWTLLFNFIKTTLTSVITFFIYKRTHRLLNRF